MDMWRKRAGTGGRVQSIEGLGGMRRREDGGGEQETEGWGG